MNLLSRRTFGALAITVSVVALPAAAASSCGSSQPSGYESAAETGTGNSSGSSGSNGSSGSSGSSGSTGSDGGASGPYVDATLVMYDGPPPNVDGGQLLCATPDGLSIKFNPMYSGFDGTHTYQVPSFVSGVDPGSVTWGSSDPTMVDLQPYITGIMITTKKAGDVTIVAKSGGMCGTAPLHITQFTVDDWNAGNARYNSGGALNLCLDGGFFDADIPDGFVFDGNLAGYDASAYASYEGDSGNCMNIPPGITNPFECGPPPPACTNCHGAVGNGKLFGMTLFTDVSHTPEQTGGFSDTDLVNVFVHGTVPAGGYFDESIICYQNWHQFHTWWDIDTTAEQTGVVSFLRSLTPKEQLGCLDLFNANSCADGG
jgi:hypothetical protein